MCVYEGESGAEALDKDRHGCGCKSTPLIRYCPDFVGVLLSAGRTSTNLSLVDRVVSASKDSQGFSSK